MLKEITKPTLLINVAKCKRNILRMVKKTHDSGVVFRPHFKTHQSKEIGSWYREVGVKCITVSSLDMAAYFIEDGWNDITVAFPTNIRAIAQINTLVSQAQLNLTCDNEDALDFLGNHLTNQIGVFLKIDLGNHRSGISPENHALIKKLINLISKYDNLLFKGFLGHAGQSYLAKSIEELKEIHRSSQATIATLKNMYLTNHSNIIASTGDTPTCNIVSDFNKIDEVRPGNFIFNDLMQWHLGSCNFEDIGVVMACPIVSKTASRNQLVIHGGAIHFSSDNIYNRKLNRNFFGYLVLLTENGWEMPDEKSFVSGLSQEHGIISVDKGFFESCKVGDLVGVLPIHSCMTANSMKSYLRIDNGTKISMMH